MAWQLPPAESPAATCGAAHWPNYWLMLVFQEDEAVREYIRKHHGTLEADIDQIDFKAAAKALNQAIDRTTKQIRERYEHARDGAVLWVYLASLTSAIMPQHGVVLADSCQQPRHGVNTARIWLGF